jgi:predicted fused transcriptional regulator/phosphomethylpyrimidine kinase
MIKALYCFVVFIVLLPYILSAGIIIDQSGCYEVVGKYEGYNGQFARVNILPNTRSEHIAKLLMAKDPQILNGMNVRFTTKILHSTHSDRLDMLNITNIEILKSNSDIYSKPWKRVTDGTCTQNNL